MTHGRAGTFAVEILLMHTLVGILIGLKFLNDVSFANNQQQNYGEWYQNIIIGCYREQVMSRMKKIKYINLTMFYDQVLYYGKTHVNEKITKQT